MLKYVASFVAGCLTVAAVIAVHSLITRHRAKEALVSKSGPVAATVTIRIAQDPYTLLPVPDASTLLDRVGDLTESEKKKIRDALASGLITEVRLQGEVSGESRWITVPLLSGTSGATVVRGSSKAKFGPAVFQLEETKRPNKAPEPTPGSVTPRATGPKSK